MKLTQTRLIIAGIAVALIVLGGAVGALQRGGGGDGESARAPQDTTGSGGPLGYVDSDSANALLPPDPSDSVTRSDGEAAEGPSAGAPSPDTGLQQLLDRKIVQSSALDLSVEEVGRSFQDIIRIAETAGGFVAGSTFSNTDDGQIADLTVRVPADRYQGTIAQIRGMGEVQQESSDANDVTEEYTDLQARLRTLEATERRYLALLGEAGNIGEILQVQDRLDGVRGQIEQAQGRINLLDHLTDLASITVHVRPLAAGVGGGGGGPDPLESASSAWEYSLDALLGIATGLLVVAAFSWWLVPPLAIAAFALRWWLGRRPASARGVSA